MNGSEITAKAFDDAANIIEKKNAWTQMAMARDNLGSPLNNEKNDKAVCFCGEGALRLVIPEFTTLNRAFDIFYDRNGRSVCMFNDLPGTTQQLMVTKFREAAEALRKDCV